MKRDMVTISDNGTVNVPKNVQMRDFEIAELFGVMVPTVKGKIKTMLKNRHFNSCAYNIVSGSSLIPVHFDLEMVVAVAFSVDSYKANLFISYILSIATASKLISEHITLKDKKWIYC